ncbi:MAG: S8 family serine peptidase [Sulfuricurvum sp.]|jgi:subtilisin family serine protease|uniref:S8 family serine peptidase n=1 Tax=Sulfuricurvum sp. TaxID=2025608 RepID=UPI0025EFAA75|nr:S8 family serine peptidase [Sulfuricurvum sp.]MCK9372360.1 S8 family serine peptidase [Sulfuricurvum sp.]
MIYKIAGIAAIFLTLFIFNGCREGAVNDLAAMGVEKKGVYKEGEVIVIYKKGLQKSAIDTLHRQCGATVKSELFKSDARQIDLVTLPSSMSTQEGIDYYKKLPEVESVEPNRIIRKYKTTPNDANISQQWHLDRDFDTSGNTTVDINVSTAWDTTQGDAGIIVAVIDTGIDTTHPDLRNQLWHNNGEGAIADGTDNDGNGYVDDFIGYDFVNQDNNPTDDDIDGHGTHVCGLIAAEGNNGIGTCGVTWKTSLMALKILNANGEGTTAGEVEAIRYAVINGARVINMSLGGACGDSPSVAEYEAIRYARDKGVLVVIAAGNETCNNDLTPTYPAGHPLDNIISVGAINRTGNSAWFSNYGAQSVHLSAPGEDIFSTLPLTKGGYGSMSGTSMATPIVTGSAALTLANNPDITYKQLREKLMGSTTPSASLSGRNTMGGRVNVAQAFLWDPLKNLPLKASPISAVKYDSNVSLFWIDNSTVENGYNVVRSQGSENNISRVWNLSPNSVQFVDAELSLGEGSTYYYWIETNNSIGTTKSNVIQINIPLAPPTITSISAPYSNQVLVQWNDLSKIEDGYIIYRSTSFWGGFTEVGRTAPNTVSYTDTSAAAETTYYYLIKTYHGAELSSESNLVQVITPKTVSPSASEPGGESGGGAFSLNEVFFLVILLLAVARKRYFSVI